MFRVAAVFRFPRLLLNFRNVGTVAERLYFATNWPKGRRRSAGTGSGRL
jgi:hypothetical protein